VRRSAALGAPEQQEDAVWLGERATEHNLKALSKLARYKMLHFATHGLLAGESEAILKARAEHPEIGRAEAMRAKRPYRGRRRVLQHSLRLLLPTQNWWDAPENKDKWWPRQLKTMPYADGKFRDDVFKHPTAPATETLTFDRNTADADQSRWCPGSRPRVRPHFQSRAVHPSSVQVGRAY
jgi:hypothetical protein